MIRTSVCSQQWECLTIRLHKHKTVIAIRRKGFVVGHTVDAAIPAKLLRPILRSMVAEVGRVRTANYEATTSPDAVNRAMLDVEDCLASISDLTEDRQQFSRKYSTFDIKRIADEMSGSLGRPGRLSQDQRLVYGDYSLLLRAVGNLRLFFEANDSRVVVSLISEPEHIDVFMSPRAASPPLRAALGRWVARGFSVESITEDGLRPLFSHRLAVAHLMFSSGGAKMIYDIDSMGFILRVNRSQQLQLEL